ncbi:MAG: SO_0444 family Cu/Zn efflux transporter [Kiritimatiellae bacterium]|nr:SO_0444 family Cu/Zn efflux transporter [Kiritimatiellia bacterium]
MQTFFIDVALEIWNTLGAMAPYLLFGFFVAGVLSVWVSSETVSRHLGQGQFLPILKSTLIGIPLPLCSCAVIPVSVSLRKQGASRGATLSFLISTPQTGVDSLFVTYSLLGIVFTMFRGVAAFVSGLIGGAVVSVIDSKTPNASEPLSEAVHDCCCSEKMIKNKVWHSLQHGFVSLPREMALPLLAGLLMAALITVCIPEDFFAGAVGSGVGTKWIMMLMGIPMYVCATASVPIAAAFVSAGVSPGAALVFLMTGPATNAATLTTIWKLMGKRFGFIYLMVVGMTALVNGIILDQIYMPQVASKFSEAHEMFPSWVKGVSAIVLTVLLVKARWASRRFGVI